MIVHSIKYCKPANSCTLIESDGRWAQANVVAPNKHNSAYEAKYRGHLLESETYIGGKVEALESGVFRSDLPCHFKLRPEAYQVCMKIETHE